MGCYGLWRFAAFRSRSNQKASNSSPVDIRGNLPPLPRGFFYKLPGDSQDSEPRRAGRRRDSSRVRGTDWSAFQDKTKIVPDSLRNGVTAHAAAHIHHRTRCSIYYKRVVLRVGGLIYLWRGVG